MLRRVDAGIIDENIDAPELGLDFADTRLDLGRRRNIHAQRHGSLQASGGGRGARLVDVADHDPRAVLGERPGNCEADAVRGAGDKGHLVFELSFHRRSPPSGENRGNSREKRTFPIFVIARRPAMAGRRSNPSGWIATPGKPGSR